MNIEIDDFKSDDSSKKNYFKKVLIIVLSVILIFVLLIIYCRFKATSGLKIIEYKITDSNLPDNFHGVKVIHISDLYYGNTVSLAYLEDIVNKINKTHPDIIVFTGDLLGTSIDDEEKNHIITLLNSLNVSIGKYAINGDNDDISLFNDIMTSAGFNILNDSSLIYYNGELPILISSTDVDSLGLFSILLLHEPDKVSNLNNNFNLIFAGHSLNGQINIPFIKNLLLPMGAKKYYYGHYNVGNSNLYVSGGIGTTNFKFRFLNKPSVNLYRLTNH